MFNSSKNTKLYVNYYLILEDIMYNYIYYQTEYQEVIISNILEDNKSLHSKIDEQSKKIDNQSLKMDEQTKQIEELLKYGKATTETLQEVSELKFDRYKTVIDYLP